MALLEICVDTHAGLKTAVESGADRIELCAALSLGGLSPSFGLLQAAENCPIPVNVMVRTRPGNFEYSPQELKAMVEEIRWIKERGFAGVVIGAGNAKGLDLDVLATLSKAADGMDITLHRVFDLLQNPVEALGPIADLGINRILTSGGAQTAVEGIERLTELVGAAPAGLSIMPGSGVTASNAAQILRTTGATELHASASQPASGLQTKESDLFGAAPRVTDGERIKELRAICRGV